MIFVFFILARCAASGGSDPLAQVTATWANRLATGLGPRPCARMRLRTVQRTAEHAATPLHCPERRCARSLLQPRDKGFAAKLFSACVRKLRRAHGP